MSIARIVEKVSRTAQDYFKSNPGRHKTLAQKMKFSPNASTGAILNKAKQEPLAAALLLLELGDLGKPYVQELIDEHPDLRNVLQDTVDPVTEIEDDMPISDLSELMDEMRVIKRMYNRFGREDLADLRRFLQLNERHFIMYEQIRGGLG